MSLFNLDSVLGLCLFIAIVVIAVLARQYTYWRGKSRALEKLNLSMCLDFGDVEIPNDFIDTMTKISLGINDAYGARFYVKALEYVGSKIDLAEKEGGIDDKWKGSEKDEKIARIKNEFYCDALSVASYACKKEKNGRELVKSLSKFSKKLPIYEERAISIKLDMDKELREVFGKIWDNNFNRSRQVEDAYPK